MKLKIITLAFCVSACLLAGSVSAARVGTGFGVNGEEESQAAIPAGTAPAIRVGTGSVAEAGQDAQAIPSADSLRASASATSLHSRLTSEGMTLISNGLYAKHNESGENFVATNAAGRLALAAKVGAVRSTIEKRYAKNISSRRAQVLLKQSADIIADLSRPAAKSSQYDDNYGGCGNGSLLRARAVSSDGNFADAYAANYIDFGPATPTNNFAMANSNYVYDMSSAIGMSPATASVLDYQSCDAQAYANVTCPDGINGVAAYAYSVRPHVLYCEIGDPR